MTARTPLPSTLAAGAFTTAELHAAGLPLADLADVVAGVRPAAEVLAEHAARTAPPNREDDQ